MHKPAETRAPLHELIRERWSPRAFARRSIEPEKILSLLEAARWAPSSSNEQPWSYFVATQEEADEFSKLVSCLVDSNAVWAQQAPLLLLAVASLKFARSGKPNRHYGHDLGLANENLVLQAQAMGLAAHQMAGFLPDRARGLFQIPEDQEPMTMIAVGYPGDASELSEELRRREESPRSRKPLDSFVFTGRWGQTATAVR